ncbi:hypothetical protein [Polaromonas sp. P5_D5]
MTHSVLISGAGQLGSRYLQGLVNCGSPLCIHVQDVDPASLARAQQRWDEVAKANRAHEIQLHTSLVMVPAAIDVAIVATTARWRPEVVREIAARTTVGAWILEKVLAQSETGLDEIEHHVGHARVWVNTPRRMLDWHQQIKAQLTSGKPMHLKVSGGAWGLACNSIHFLDMFAWWTGETPTTFDTSELAPGWIESKRPGNWEVMGTLKVDFSGGSTAALEAGDGDVFYRFELDDGIHRWAIDEAAGTAKRSDGLDLPGRLPFQSEVSGALIESILVSNDCALPTLEQSLEIHRPYIRALLDHWRVNVDVEADAVPIT